MWGRGWRGQGSSCFWLQAGEFCRRGGESVRPLPQTRLWVLQMSMISAISKRKGQTREGKWPPLGHTARLEGVRQELCPVVETVALSAYDTLT